ncbi:MAG: hypothetical protein Q9191_003183 [Dirinaria sp. TL-2023a]
MNAVTFEKDSAVCSEQPKPILPPSFDFESIRPASRSSRPSQWLAEGRQLASRASSRASFSTRRRRTTVGSIGAPYDFKKVEPPPARARFRPLTLSIHIPGNELSPLPEFDRAHHDDSNGLTFPQRALTKSRSDPILSRPSTSFAILRKPVPSYAALTDFSRCSMDSRYTLNTLPSLPQSSATSQQPPTRRPSIASTSQSTRDFLDSLDTRLPQSPPLLRSKSGPEPVYTLYRRASEQSLRLRTHLEERERVTAWCDTILEDNKEGDGDRSATVRDILQPTTPTETKAQLSSQRSAEWFGSPLFPSLNQGSQQRNQEAVTSWEERNVSRPPVPSTRSRISQWLLRSTPPISPIPMKPFYSLRPSFSTRRRPSISSSSIYSSASTAADLATTTTTATMTARSSPHRKGSSLSSSVTMYTTVVPSLADVEKVPLPMDVEVREVGVAI